MILWLIDDTLQHHETAEATALLVPGAKVMVTAQEKAGKPTALRIIVGRDGFAPPM